MERLGFALEPEADYERRSDGGGGCEDPRITYVEPLQRYVMTYAALSSVGPRIAFAISEDLFSWRRLGLARFESYRGIDFIHVDNKDASLFPVALANHAGKLQLALLHRPLFPGTRPEEVACHKGSRNVDLDHESIWISYSPIPPAGVDRKSLGLFNSHHRLASPVKSWARLKVGAGTPPILTRLGWLLIYHGVSEMPGVPSDPPRLCYSAGVMLLAKDQPQQIRYRSSQPILTPSYRRNAAERSPMSSFPLASIAGMIWVCQTASIFITAWRTAVSGSRVWIYPMACRPRAFPPMRKARSSLPSRLARQIRAVEIAGRLCECIQRIAENCSIAISHILRGARCVGEP